MSSPMTEGGERERRERKVDSRETGQSSPSMRDARAVALEVLSAMRRGAPKERSGTATEILSEANPEVRVEIRGFGVLGVKKAKAKPKARNPKTNEVIFVPPHQKAFFKPGKLLMRSLQKPLLEQES